MTALTAIALAIPEITADMDNVSAALAYAAAGWYVLPVKRGSKKAGSVVGVDWQHKSSRDPEQIAAWFAGTNHGIALHCGRSGAVAFDVDDPDKLPAELAEHLGDAPHQSTRPNHPGRGHYLFMQPRGRDLGNGAGALGSAWGEIRGRNGVIIAAPSVHAASGEYEWQRTGPVPVLPDDLATMLPDATPTDDAATPDEVAAFIAAHQQAERPEILAPLVRKLADNIEAGGSRHVSAVSLTAGAMKEARVGYYAANTALDALKPIFMNAVTVGENKRTPAAAEHEWAGIVAWAIGQAKAADLDAVRARVEEKMPSTVTEVAGIRAAPTAEPMSLADCHAVFRNWLGCDYDTDALDAMLATAAVERFDDGSDPVWLLVVGGPGNAKTETVQSCDGIGAVVTSSLSSEAALLSATPRRERTKAATGGLLRKIGNRGVLVIKDVTSILSMNRDLRARVLAALREVYDGRWYREVGTDGGLTIPWEGRLVVVGAVTTAWDTAHGVVSSMGDRFVLVRLDSTKGRQKAGRKAIGNTGSEQIMRAELAAAVAGVLAGMDPEPIEVTEAETDVLLAAADLVTLARTGVESDYRGDVIDAHAPEMPTRFAKQLTQIVRGAVAVGIARPEALRLAIRCARDSMPPMRLAIIEDIAKHPASSTADVRKRIDKPRNTVDRQLQALHILGVATVEEIEYQADGKTKWYYSLADGIEPDAIDPKSVPDLSVHTPSPSVEGSENATRNDSPASGGDISGTPPAPAHCRYCAAEIPESLRSARARGYCGPCTTRATSESKAALV